MEYAIRNKVSGKVVEIKKGNLMCEVIVEVSPDFAVTSVITIDSLNESGVKVGDSVTALVKAINVVLVKD